MLFISGSFSSKKALTQRFRKLTKAIVDGCCLHNQPKEVSLLYLYRYPLNTSVKDRKLAFYLVDRKNFDFHKSMKHASQ